MTTILATVALVFALLCVGAWFGRVHLRKEQYLVLMEREYQEQLEYDYHRYHDLS